MSANSSSSVFNSSFSLLLRCFSSRRSIFIFSAFSIVYILLLPLFIFVLFLGYQQWRKQRSISTTATRHSDVFTFHSVCTQLNTCVGFVLCVSGALMELPKVTIVGLCVWSSAFLGQGLFHLLTCVERYLAVVHPVTYLGLRQSAGIRIRNISVGGVWLLSVGWMVLQNLTSSELELIVYACFMVFNVTVVSFCSVSVLCALKRPRPGEGGGDRERVDQLKQRAFHTIMAIMGVLLFKLGGNLILFALYNTALVGPSEKCVVVLSAFWIDLPSSLVLPLLFLHRVGKLHCCIQNTKLK